MKATATKPRKTIKQQIKRRNTAYTKATPAKRRVMIARDALAQLKNKTYRAKPGIWCEVYVDGMEADGYKPLQPLLLSTDEEVSCQCCGVGSLFLSYVRLNNKAQYHHGWSFWDIAEKTGWPEANLNLIEIAFEVGRGRNQWLTGENEHEARYFGKKYTNPTERLEAILKNIVTNKGTFKP